MSQVDPDEVLELFLAARLLDESDRRDLLDRRCADRPALRREIESLLGFATPDGATEVGIGKAARAAARPDDAIRRDGDRLGPFRLIRLLGEGGFGEVFLAEQERPVARRVALKLLKRRSIDGSFETRFEAERQALAMMGHPGIARLYDAGQGADGRPYFSMELVEGEPITEHVSRLGVALRDRVALLADVARAVQHAHSRGIIHRDIKPSNVLVTEVDGRWAVKVIDFGIAKAIEMQRGRGDGGGPRPVVGTPPYSSPEQASGDPDIDARTDVYSLGVLLYELLAGSTPLHGRTRDGALGTSCYPSPTPSPSTWLRCIVEESARAGRPRPAGLEERSRRLVGDLDWIVSKAIAPDRAQRYQTAHELASDLERYLAHEPVSAAPASAPYLLRTFVRRHRRAAWATAVATAALVAGTIVSIVYAEKARREQARLRATVGFFEEIFQAMPGRGGELAISATEIESDATRLGLPAAVTGGALLFHAETQRAGIDPGAAFATLARSRDVFRDSGSVQGELRAVGQAALSFMEANELERAADACADMVELARTREGDRSWQVADASRRLALVRIAIARESRTAGGARSSGVASTDDARLSDVAAVDDARSSSLAAIDAFDRTFGRASPEAVRARCEIISALADALRSAVDPTLVKEAHGLAAEILPDTDRARLAIVRATMRHGGPLRIEDRIRLQRERVMLHRAIDGRAAPTLAAEVRLGAMYIEAGMPAEAERSFRSSMEVMDLDGMVAGPGLAVDLWVAMEAIGKIDSDRVAIDPRVVARLGVDACSALMAQSVAGRSYRAKQIWKIAETVDARSGPCSAITIYATAVDELMDQPDTTTADLVRCRERLNSLSSAGLECEQRAALDSLLHRLGSALSAGR